MAKTLVERDIRGAWRSYQWGAREDGQDVWLLTGVHATEAEAKAAAAAGKAPIDVKAPAPSAAAEGEPAPVQRQAAKPKLATKKKGTR